MTVTPSEDNSPSAAPPPVRRFPEGVALILAAIFGAAMVLAALLLGGSLLAGSSSPTEAAGSTTETTVGGQPSPSETEPDPESDAEPPPGSETTTPPASEPSTSTTESEPSPRSVACPEGTDPVICDAAEFVQQTRRRSFKTFPPVALLGDADFDAEVRSQLAGAEAELAETGVILRALGLLPPDASYVELYRSLIEVGVVGFYDPDSERLVVRGQEFDLFAQGVLVHELTHALDDQWFDLDRESGDGDATYAFSAVVEGNASRVDRLWFRSLAPDQQAAYRAQERSAVSADELELLRSLPAAVQRLQASPYVDGEAYVSDLVAGGGEPAVDAALSEPPTTSEQVLHPGLDRAADPEIVVPLPATDPTVDPEVDGRLGELLLRLWLGRVAADGWGGDRFVAWRQGSASCLRVDVGADSPADLEDVLGAAEAWVAGDGEQRSVEAITTEAGELLRISGCS